MLGEGRACRSPALATGNGRSWVSGGAPGHVGEAAQRVQPGARACRTPSRSPPGPRAARSALPPRVSMFQEAAHSGGRILKSPPVSAGARGVGGLQQVPRHPLPRASPARLQGRRLSRPALSQGLSGRRAGLRGRLSGSQPGGPRSRLINDL